MRKTLQVLIRWHAAIAVIFSSRIPQKGWNWDVQVHQGLSEIRRLCQ